ncbi:Alkaline phosphatase synthesis transcriptional regulatory protein PhoP [Stieleria neptunia]|uniref:Alkaline phosphatase synthesis transcriptional regulatory protein PhoP n=1 Tax=Stieleria neptunia TaxID=2527979 RepID=A0A518I088_9BACT|nr:response regulator [Stieleria neptunia]QDV46533.1 Alkaline phosphatase synthesis transcriptional regulatory protein PhoP [Stieleria neptunia]
MPTEKRKVLIAEDNPGLARVLSFKFKSCGFEPITCGNGGEAWKSFCDSQVAAVVSDHEMPIMSGIELIERVREMDATLPCFLVTGRQLELSRDPRVVKLKIQTVFGKPFSPGTVVSAVSDAINQQASASACPPAAAAAPAIGGMPATGLPEASA